MFSSLVSIHTQYKLVNYSFQYCLHFFCIKLRYQTLFNPIIAIVSPIKIKAQRFPAVLKLPMSDSTQIYNRLVIFQYLSIFSLKSKASNFKIVCAFIIQDFYIRNLLNKTMISRVKINARTSTSRL